jgi:hypothetical protein
VSAPHLPIAIADTSDNQGRTDSGEAVTVNQHHFGLLYLSVRSQRYKEIWRTVTLP